MIVFVDNEHVSGYDQPCGEKIMANRIRIKYELEDMSNDSCLVVRWNRVTPELLRDVGARALFISGNSATADRYDSTEQAGLREVLLAKEWPTLGFCGGHQVMGETYGAPLEPIGPRDRRDEAFGAEADATDDMTVERGYLPVELSGTHPILEGLGEAPVFRQAHSWELKAVPEAFTNYASSPVSAIQLMIHDDLPIAGTQFHPEYATDEHPAGRRLIENFMRWSGLI